MSKYYDEKPLEYVALPDLEPGEYRGHAWSVKQSGGKYILSFISGSLLGKEVVQEIAKIDYDEAKNGTFNLDSICRKYNIG
jgi:hypothetical protein